MGKCDKVWKIGSGLLRGVLSLWYELLLSEGTKTETGDQKLSAHVGLNMQENLTSLHRVTPTSSPQAETDKDSMKFACSALYFQN